MKRWFTGFPFLGWIMLLLICWVTAYCFYKFEQKQFTEPVLAGAVQEHFSQVQQQIQQDLHSGKFRDSDRYLTDPGAAAPYYYFLIRDSIAVYWNGQGKSLNTSMLRHPEHYTTGRIEKLHHGFFFVKNEPLPDSSGARRHLLTLIPICYDYDFENEYFESHFLADRHIPSSTTVEGDVKMLKGGYPILESNGTVAFSLVFRDNPADFFRVSIWVWLFAIGFLCTLFFWINKMGVHLAKTRHPLAGWLLLFASCLIFNWLRQRWNIPAGFSTSSIFSPELLASGESIRSFADLICVALLDCWLLIFFIKYIPLKTLQPLLNKHLHRLLLVVFILLLLNELYKHQSNLIYSLVIDSKISFDVSDYTEITIFTILGLGALLVVTLNFILLLSIVNALTRHLISTKVPRYIFILLLSMLCIYLAHDREVALFYAVMLAFSAAGLVFMDSFGIPLPVFTRPTGVTGNSSIYAWFIILCSWITLEVTYFNFVKERELRKIFAAQQVQKEDALMHFAFEELALELQHAAYLQRLFHQAGQQERNLAERRIKMLLKEHNLTKFQTSLYFFKASGQTLMPEDSTGLLQHQRIRQLSGGGNSPGLQYIEKPSAGLVYWGFLPVLSQHDTLGFVGFGFSTGREAGQRFVSTLIQQNYNPTDQQYFNRYSFAYYKDNTLRKQDGEQIFPFQNAQRQQVKEYEFRETLFTSTLYFQPGPNEMIQVVYKRNLVTGVIALFSYVLALLILLSGLIFFFSFFVFNPARGQLWRRRINLTIRSKITITVLSTSLLSLVFLALLTISFLKNRYKETQQKSLQNLMFYLGQNIVHYFENLPEGSPGDKSIYPRQDKALTLLLEGLSEEQAVDINLYDPDGYLVATSLKNMYQRGFLTPYINRNVLTDLRTGLTANLLTTETIGDLAYKSHYLPLRNNNNETVAYLNLPYYASEEEQRKEISSIIIVLVNIYTVIFFIAGIVAILISNSIIRSFRLLIDQFRSIRLKHNVVIHWPYHDELGLLVKEYNEMILKVEDMAAKLAYSEREAAWRELAMQIAHEIKNPLTPMKLNIQYLQQVSKSGRGDIEPLVSRLTESLIEQIENLNIIASEFAHFAKMPEARPEVLHVDENLRTVAGLFMKEQDIDVELSNPYPQIHVYMDKSYFIRIFNNLIKNAEQAIPHDRHGKIRLKVAKEKSEVIISVEDNGTGIPEALQAKMFIPHFTTKSSGSGLGLSMCKKMVEFSDGRMWFETKTEVGTIFFVALPEYPSKGE